MTRDDIIRMAKEASSEHDYDFPNISALERFAALVAAAEREAILEHCEAMRRAHTGYQAPSGLMQLIDTIRARGESK
jgi:hypothetical protein